VENKEIVIGYGKVHIIPLVIEPDKRHGIALRPMADAQLINSKDPNWTGPSMKYEFQDGDIIIWLDTLEGARVFQDAVNIACLELNGYSVEDKSDQEAP